MLLAAQLPIAASAAGYGQGKAVNAQNQPIGAVEFQAQYTQNDAYALTQAADSILLTFDQGYENGCTAQILDTLKAHDVKALFFITGDYAKSQPELIRRMIAEGHCIGNHGMQHLKASALTNDALREEIGSLHEYVLQHYGYEMQYFRPPCGDYDAETLDIAQEMGYKTVFWSFAYVDWKTDAQPDLQTAKQTLIQAAHPNGIYLLHSVSTTNTAILGDVITQLKAMGYHL